MKKTSLMKLYSLLPNNTENITESLPLLLRVKGESEDILFKLIEDNDKYIFEDNIDDFIELSISIGEMNNSYYREYIKDNAIKLMHNKVVRDYCLFKEVIDQLVVLLEFHYWRYFDIEDGDPSFYASYVINEFTKFFEKIEDAYDVNQFDQIFDATLQVLSDLNNTRSNKYKYNESKLSRISNFFDLISDKEVYALPEYKLYLIIEASKFATSNEELKRLKYIARFNQNKSNQEFEEIIDASISEMTSITIDKIYKEIEYTGKTEKTEYGATTTYWPKPKHPEKLNKALEKVLNNNKNS